MPDNQDVPTKAELLDAQDRLRRQSAALKDLIHHYEEYPNRTAFHSDVAARIHRTLKAA